jgi:mannose-6-phosphate isomerase-like protein (cupin superfamily)
MREGTLNIHDKIGPETGAKAISLRVLEFGPGLSPALRNEVLDEVLFSLDSCALNCCTLVIGEHSHELEPQSGVFIPSHQTFRVENRGKDSVYFVSSLVPAERRGIKRQIENPIVRLADQRAMPTGDRWYRVLIDSEVTQFVGSIPPGRAPDHFHEYEEVLFILRGEGRVWLDDRSSPIEVGSCVYLPQRQVHCVENTGEDELRLLGVFYPAGSPAVRYETESATQNP